MPLTSKIGGSPFRMALGKNETISPKDNQSNRAKCMAQRVELLHKHEIPSLNRSTTKQVPTCIHP
jgi:hypothetical protein